MLLLYSSFTYRSEGREETVDRLDGLRTCLAYEYLGRHIGTQPTGAAANGVLELLNEGWRALHEVLEGYRAGHCKGEGSGFGVV